MSKAGRAAVAVLAAAAVLWLTGWLDGTVMRDIRQQEAATWDPTGLSLALCPRGGRGRKWRARARRPLVALAFSPRRGGLPHRWGLLRLHARDQLVGRGADQRGPTRVAGPIADAVGQIYFWSNGPLNAIATVGAGMFLAGLLVIGGALRARMVGRRATDPRTGIEGQPVT